MNKTKVLFVCLGNICRSPTAEGVFRHVVAERNLAKLFEIDSAGTSDWHVNKSPDGRTVKAAAKRGYDLSSFRGRQAVAKDFEHFDYILAMDESNLSNLRALAPANHSANLGLFLDFAHNFDQQEVPDPYYGGADGFELVLDLIEDASNGFLEQVLDKLS